MKTFYLAKIKVNLFQKEAFFDKIANIVRSENSVHHIVTLNPEMIVDAQKDNVFKNIINKAHIVMPDGVGIVKALRLLYPKEVSCFRVPGTDLVYEIMQRSKEKFFLFGARDPIIKKAYDCLKKEFKNVDIVGIAGGYNFSSADIVKKINNSQATILFVALGHPYQEKWIFNHLNDLSHIKIAVGVGGAFDFIAGQVKRAPCFLRKIGLEWLWRFFRQPWRFKRIFKATVLFSIIILKEKFKLSH